MFASSEKDEVVMSGMYKCEGLFADFIHKFKPGYGQMKSVLTETDRSAKPTMILSAPDVNLTDVQTAEITHLTQLYCLGNNPSQRRRYALIIFQHFAFIIGGYDFDVKTKIRSQPLHDFVYDVNKKTCRSIPTFPPPGRVSFGVAPSERYILVIGGHTYDNISLSSVFILDTQNIDKGETDMLSSHYQMDFREKVWRQYADLNPPRARTLVICIDNGNELEIYTAGGYTLVHDKALVIDKIHSYDAQKDQWNRLTDIPDLRIDHAITIAQTKLIISEEIPNLDETDQPIMIPIRMYDFESGIWKNIQNDENSNTEK
ncbi:hypothetical protein I4U23_008378 [Adineta vaga]|nr:hypothetical protein I4U23_008378 [Adineta vaga]